MGFPFTRLPAYTFTVYPLTALPRTRLFEEGARRVDFHIPLSLLWMSVPKEGEGLGEGVPESPKTRNATHSHAKQCIAMQRNPKPWVRDALVPARCRLARPPLAGEEVRREERNARTGGVNRFPSPPKRGGARGGFPFTRLPVYPFTRLPAYPLTRSPAYPTFSKLVTPKYQKRVIVKAGRESRNAKPQCSKASRVFRPEGWPVATCPQPPTPNSETRKPKPDSSPHTRPCHGRKS